MFNSSVFGRTISNVQNRFERIARQSFVGQKFVDGVEDGINVGDCYGFLSTDEWTVLAFFNLDGSNVSVDERMIISRWTNQGRTFGVEADNAASPTDLLVNHNGATRITGVNDVTYPGWRGVFVTMDGSANLRAAVIEDGQFGDISTGSTTGDDIDAANVVIGGRDSGQEEMDGSIAHVCIIDGVIVPDGEILQYFRDPAPILTKYRARLIGYWPLGKGTGARGSIELDYSGRGNHGTIGTAPSPIVINPARSLKTPIQGFVEVEAGVAATAGIALLKLTGLGASAPVSATAGIAELTMDGLNSIPVGQAGVPLHRLTALNASGFRADIPILTLESLRSIPVGQAGVPLHRLTALNPSGFRAGIAPLNLDALGPRSFRAGIPLTKLLGLDALGFRAGIPLLNLDSLNATGALEGVNEAGIAILRLFGLNPASFRAGLPLLRVEGLNSVGFQAGIPLLKLDGLGPAGFRAGIPLLRLDGLTTSPPVGQATANIALLRLTGIDARPRALAGLPIVDLRGLDTSGFRAGIPILDLTGITARPRAKAGIPVAVLTSIGPTPGVLIPLASVVDADIIIPDVIAKDISIPDVIDWDIHV